MPKVSVVMPVYNGEEYLAEAIDSIIAQTFTDWEFIIVNEYGSSEAATAILEAYARKEPRIRLVQNTERLRIAESLNVGLRLATGEFIARMDADDISGSRRLEEQLAFLESHPDIDICGIEVSMFGENTWDWPVYCGSDYLRCSCLFFTPFVHPTIMMRTASLRKYSLEYDPRFTYTEDFDFFTRASAFLTFENIKDRSLYHYRYTCNNATNVGGDRGLEFQREVMERTFQQYNLEFTSEEILVLSPNTNLKLENADDTQRYLEQLDLLLKRIFLSKELQQKFGVFLLFRVLHRRWMDAFEQVRWKQHIMEDGQVQRAIERGLFYHEDFWDGSKVSAVSKTPVVSILIPTYNSEDYILDTVYSLLAQDYTDFELLVVNELGSDDRTLECVSMFHDPRIRVLQNDVRLGLAESLNRGIREAAGKYIARADADDVYPRDRLGKQVSYMDAHPDITICGSWQRHFGQRNYIHTPPASPEDMKANLLFKCEVCHSTLMLRREDFIRHDLWYDNTYLSEDYELWCRASSKVKFATIPEVLGEYRWNGDNITVQKMDRLDKEGQHLVARNLKEHLGMDILDEDLILLSGWKNPFYDSNPDYIQLREREAKLLDAIMDRNDEVHAFDADSLKKVLDQRRAWAFIGGTPAEAEPYVMLDPSQTRKKGIMHYVKRFLKRILKPFYLPIRYRFIDPLRQIDETLRTQQNSLAGLQQAVYDSDGHLYDYYTKLNTVLESNVHQIAQLQEMKSALYQEVTALQGMVKEYADTIQKMVQTSPQLIDDIVSERMNHAEQQIDQMIREHLLKTAHQINQTTDTRIWEAEKLINQITDTRIWKAEKHIDGGFWNLHYEIAKQNADNNQSSVIYDDMFYWENRYGSVKSARTILSFVLKHLNVQSILDLGCGTGTWLWVAKNQGVADILGVDGDYVPRNMLMIPEENFRSADLESGYPADRRFDMAMSLEVAEHLSAAAADTFVKSLCDSADIVLFSAAHPGQGGDGHINEQPVSYWIEKFKHQGYLPVEIRHHFADSDDVESWYKDNIILFVNQATNKQVVDALS